MVTILLTLHVIAFALALGGRFHAILLLRQSLKQGLNEKLEAVTPSIQLTRIADSALIVAVVTGVSLFLVQGYSLSTAPWSYKLKLILFALLFINIGASHVAQSRVLNHLDSQMIPVVQKLNLLAVSLMCGMVFFGIQ